MLSLISSVLRTQLFRVPQKQTLLTISTFSWIRLKREARKEQTEKTSEKTPEDEATKLWMEAVNEFRHTEVTPPERRSMTISRSESRRMKKRAFLHAIRVYLLRHGKTRRGFNQFARNALEKMAEYEVTEDLECYKAILQLFPTGRMVVTSFLQAEWGHFPRQQNTVISLLQQMTKHHVIPDDEVGQMIIDIFGWRNHAMQFYRHLMYWIPKLAHANPWPVATNILDDLEEDPLRLARLIAERICPDRMVELHTIKLSASDRSTSEPSGLISAQSPEQRAILAYVVNKKNQTSSPKPVIYLDGPRFVWYQRLQATYYTLWTEVDKDRMHREIKLVEHRDNRPYIKDLSGLPLSGHLSSSMETELDQVPQQFLSSCTELEPIELKKRAALIEEAKLDVNKALLKHPSSRVPRVQPEYDNRWSALRESHAYAFLPTELTVHEQGEGTVLAIGVLSPIADALVNQKIVFDHTVSETADASKSVTRNHRELPCVPTPAPTSLIRAWLNHLQAQNPCLKDATLVIRVSSPTDPLSNSEHTAQNDETHDEPQDISVRQTVHAN
ncbi:Evolutionarily conserved signaling intermediate in Toll pathway mitochondrial [Paragonimus heterotremus]|uniref:Evolutionarily conserved signaling intermediate in Toll pathway mitochondrial n=1 Tax=Paragonimus heterotremus TaxID=100268 RepID=A0A8J4TPI7_9TREM|nr:Evolutionarily conserved signaling intermediate in Toll pathway mitochondrial [Paragonimus heterotremus]